MPLINCHVTTYVDHEHDRLDGFPPAAPSQRDYGERNSAESGYVWEFIMISPSLKRLTRAQTIWFADNPHAKNSGFQMRYIAERFLADG